MVRKTDPSDDDWRDVKDAKKRKQIQDRLAQRARRQRLREAKKNTKQGEEEDETRRRDDSRSNGDPLCALLLDAAWPPAHYDDCEMVPIQADVASCASSRLSSVEFLPVNIGSPATFQIATARQTSPQALVISPASQPHYPLTVMGALYLNGAMLGLPCATVVPAKSIPVGPEVPLPLQPTELQLITIHSRWIDRFPFPKMRNSLISLSGVIDDEEFVRDLALMPSFEMVSGRQPWDPRAWKIMKPFADKWGYLFFG